MKARSKLVWKLTAVVTVIVAVAIGLSAYVHNLIWADYLLASSRSLLRFNSESIVKGIGHQMMSRDDRDIEELVVDIARDSQVYRDIRLVSHYSGEVIASRSGGNFGTRSLEDWSCAVCHAQTDLGGPVPKTHDAVIDRSEADRLLSVMAPIVNEPSCRTADCHEHADDPQILGFVNADYTLHPADASVAERRIRVMLTVIASLLLGFVASWFMFGPLLEKPICELIAGTKQLAAHRLDFRFHRKRRDEFGLLQESFNAMTATIQASQDELRDAKEYLEGIIEHSADMIIAVNTEGLIETFNRGGEELLGYDRKELIGRQIESLYVDPSERQAAASRLEETGSVKNYETRLLTKDGQVCNVLLTLSRLRDSEGRSIGTIGISKDLTQEKKLQDELRDAKEYLEGMVEHSADIIITVNREGLIETFNRGGEEALGYCRAEVIGKPIESLFVDPRERSAATTRLKDTDDVKNYETRLLAKDGQIRNVLLTLSRLRDSESRPIGTIGISKDITQEKKLQRELIQSQRFAAIGQAVTGIQHAIKNMLNALKGGAYLVRNGMAKDDRQRVEDGWAMVEEGIERISSLSHNMLNFARDWKPELQTVDLGELVVSICDLNRQTASEHGVVLRHQACQGLPSVISDPKLVHMATTDIVVNAIDACAWKHYADDETPEVVLTTSAGDNGDSFVIEIRDNGCGMSEEIRKNIFTPFFSTKKALGSGLGLAVTARIIRVLGGEISVESEPDRGTTFRIHVPKDGPRDGRGGG